VFENSNCIGMIEGIVEENQKFKNDLVQHVSKNAAFIPITPIKDFLLKIEQNSIEEMEDW
jgi:hypothetical protein